MLNAKLKLSKKILLLILFVIFVTLFVLSIECKEYDLTPQCDVSKYGSECYKLDPFPVIRKVCVSKLFPSITLYDRKGRF
mgnify:CR=1 FL=1